MTPWREYQEQVACLFRDQGLSAEVEVSVKGVRATHDIDVWVQFQMFGLDHKWAIECKLWKSPIPKEKVLTLKSIVEDVGADKGILVAESGFQEGAISAATSTNIWLTTLDELRFRTRYDLQHILLDDYERHAIYLLFRMNEFWEEIDHPTEETIFTPILGMDGEEIRRIEDHINQIEHGFRKVKIGRFPVTMNLDKTKTVISRDIAEFIEVVGPVLDDIEGWISDHIDYVLAFREMREQAHREEYERAQRVIEEKRREKKAQS